MMETDHAAFFPPVPEAARLYPGKVMHARLMPFGHRFTYRVFSLLIDLDRLSEAEGMSRLFSVNRRNFVSFHERDHLDEKANRDGLRSYVDRLLGNAGANPAGRIQLLCYPRIFGYVFNPLSVYYCYGGDGTLSALIYEVRNTFRERHTYVCPIEPGEITASGLRQERTKIFYVSPFIDLGTRYLFRMTPPGDTVRLRILETEGGKPLLSATFSGEAEDLTTANLCRQLIRLPFMTMKILLGIHWEALKLWIKGAKFHSRGTPPAPVSYRDAGHGLDPAE
ncbi:DUF1365 domain-containing protein [Oricola cellulosilytica]|uniref:DUF1365 domain-containing protein n=1 Tax=Oricola cellulosilytica TaxID=1429082 RepID=A0A4R0P5Z4_9HYPH|nr:DUF1365 domain-containing protein [Oricola cellulosilytica]TCD12333.1 DUF1365 domain-containing protein [Oricola cellulosilytica]